ncbi:MAG: regulatory protein RecX [Gammaproteobacteria bacterium]|nr:MAG: regulatory protein RecX [Gammaproteobacteria bacterium]
MLDKEAIRTAAIDYLSRREHSKKELFDKIFAKGAQQSDIKEVISNLEQNNLQSDDRFTEGFINSRINKGHGPLKIVTELKNKGIDISTCELGYDQHQWIELAKKVREKRFGKELPQDQNNKAKQIRFLQYRGFNFDQVKCAINENEHYE